MAKTPQTNSRLNVNPVNKTLSSDKPEGFFKRLLSIIGVEPDIDRQKKKVLKDLKNQLKHSKGRFFKLPDLADVGLAKYFYDVYSSLSSAQNLLQNALASQTLKNIFIEQELTEKQRALKEELTEDSIRAKSKTVPFDQLFTSVKNDLTDYMAALEIETQKKIDKRYNLFLIFMDMVNYNYFFLLKKFDSSLPEKDFSYSPRFEAINGEYVIDDLKDYLPVCSVLTSENDWEGLFDTLKAYKGLDVVARANWKKILNTTAVLNRSKLLVQLTQYFSRDPQYLPKLTTPGERIVDAHITQVRNTVETILKKIGDEKKNDKVGALVKQIFGAASVSRTKNYTEKANLAFQKKRVPGYIYVEPMNFLKAFLLDYLKRDIRDLCNLLLVKGLWVPNTLAQPMSEAFNTLMENSDKLTAFDESLSEDAEKGQKLKVLLTRSDKDQNALVSIKQQLKDINGTAKVMIIESANLLIVVGKHLKMAIEDYTKPKHELIANWKILENSTEKKILEWMVETYKLIYAFIQLLQVYVKDKPE